MNKSAKLRILVADDHALMRSGIRMLLESKPGWKVVSEAATGRQAIEQAIKLEPDVAIVDIELPDLDGLEAIRQIREATPNTQVLTLTMHDSGQMIRRALQAGARGYVTKADLPTQLVKAVMRVAEGEVFLTSAASETVLQELIKGGKEFSRPDTSPGHPTPRQFEIIRLLAEGKENKEIAAVLGITVRTVESHRAQIMLRLGFHSLTELVHYAIRNKIVSAREF
jgi:two-component system, NarL family, response regulator NreC